MNLHNKKIDIRRRGVLLSSTGEVQIAHTDTTGQTPNDHHSQIHAIDGSDHTGTLDHSEINDNEPEKHRVINDLITSSTGLWSSEKIQSELDSISTSTGGIDPGAHRSLDQLVHAMAEDSYVEISRSGGRVSSVITYTDIGKTKKIREITYSRTAGRITQVILKQYDSNGNIISGETLTGDITRSNGGRIQSVNWNLL